MFNDGGNRAAAKDIDFENPRDRRLRVSRASLLCLGYGLFSLLATCFLWWCHNIVSMHN